MAHLEDLKEGALIKGIRPDGPVTIVNVKWHGDSVVELTYKDSSGRPGNELLFRDREPTIEVIEPGQSWSFDADAGMLRLVSEAYRIRMAYLFDPLLAVHTSLIDPLPHQITAVYEEMIPRQPLRYLLADDPGAGKTIMAGLLIKELMVPGKPLATFVCPGHPLLDATTDIILERYRNLLRQGAVFLNESDPSEDVRALFYIEHSVADARTDKRGERRVVSRQIQFVEIDEQGDSRNAGYAPYLDYRPFTEEERSLITPSLQQKWLHNDLESRATDYAITHLVPKHFKEVKDRKEELITKTIAAVKERLTKEIAYWDHRAEELKAQELAGKINARINSAKARVRADELQARLQNRLEELEKEKQLSPLPPVVMGGALVVPGGLLARLRGKRNDVPDLFARETKRVEQMAMQAVMELEKSLDYIPRDVSRDNCGYDIESTIPACGKLRFIEVKGRLQGAKTVTVTKNEILTALNKPDDFILAIVLVPPSDEGPGTDPWQMGDPALKYGTTLDGCRVYYIRRPFTKEPDFGVTSVNYEIRELLKIGQRGK